MNCTKISISFLTLIAVPVLSQAQQSTPNDHHALHTIFEDRHIADNALTIHRRAGRMPLEERYQFLSRWVLPNPDHDTIRMSLGFTPTHPAPPVQGEDSRDLGRLQKAEQAGLTRVQIGGHLVAPAIDLVETAHELGKLEEVRTTVALFKPTGRQQQRSRLAMLILIESAQEEFAAAVEHLQDLFLLVQEGTQTSFFERCPETIAIWAALRHSETRSSARELLIPILNSQLRRNLSSGEPAWDFHIQAMWGQMNVADLESVTEREEFLGMPPELQQWAGTNRVFAASRGRGNPPARWQTDAGRVENLAIHGGDYLYFQSPLRGSYEVECDIAPFEWRDSSLSIAGNWVVPVSNLTSYQSGNVRIDNPRRPLSRKMVQPREWFRYRTVVRDNVCSTYFNGRKILEEPLPAEFEPWLAIRALSRNAGVTRGLRITGDPVIPESVRLCASKELPGWLSYFDESVGSQNDDWSYRDNLFFPDELVGRRQPKYAGTGKESLLYYLRPMLENGEIEYEFYYREGESETHPALDRLAFIIDRRGVRIHWITDGKYDSTHLDPLNITVEPPNHRGPTEIPLKDNDWNHLKIKLVDNNIRLSLNGQEIYERELESTNQRTFGLFHYADRTESRVRNIIWKGAWPRTLPAVKEQELAGDGTDFLDEDLPKLTAVFEHDFASGGLPDDRFTVFETGWQELIVTQPDGVRVTRPGQNGKYLNYSIVPRLTIKGDFDVTASFKNFEPLPESRTKETKCSLILSAVLRDADETRTYLFRRHVRTPNRDDDRLIQGSFSQIVDAEIRRNYFGTITFEAESGTLRLARRGKQLYYLVAEHDSSYFRLIGEATLSDADLFPEGLRIQTQTAGPGSCRVVWTKLSIRATELIDSAAEIRAQSIAELKQQLTGDLPANALEFDGRTQYVSVPSIRYDGSHPITLEAYVTHDRLRSCVVGDTESSGIAIGVPEYLYKTYAWNGKKFGAAISTDPAPTHLRVHLAGTFNGQTVAIFVNGKLLKSAPLNGEFVPSGFPLTIGASPSSNASGIDYPLAGLIDEVRISKTVRYTKDFEPAATLETDDKTLAVYHFDEGQGETLTDSSGNEHHGEIRGVKWVDDSAFRHRAALGLVKFGHYAVDVLTEALKHENPDVRIEAATALGLIGKDAKSAISALQQLTGDDDQRVRTSVQQAITTINEAQ